MTFFVKLRCTLHTPKTLGGMVATILPQRVFAYVVQALSLRISPRRALGVVCGVSDTLHGARCVHLVLDASEQTAAKTV